MLSARTLVSMAKGFEAAGIVGVSAGVNLLTGQVDAVCGRKLWLGLVGALLVVLSGVLFLFCHWGVSELREAKQGDVLEVEDHLGKHRQQRRTLCVRLLLASVAFMLGIAAYAARRWA